MKTARLTWDGWMGHIGFGIAALLLLVGGWAPRAHAAESPAATKEADEIFKTRCSTCHGTGGKGDGAAAAALNPKPRDMTDAGWQKSVTDEHIEKIILSGGPAVGKSPLMPANPDLNAKPDVVKALRHIVRDFGKKK